MIFEISNSDGFEIKQVFSIVVGEFKLNTDVKGFSFNGDFFFFADHPQILDIFCHKIKDFTKLLLFNGLKININRNLFIWLEFSFFDGDIKFGRKLFAALESEFDWNST